MSIHELLATLEQNDIQLVLKDGQLVVQGNRQALSDSGLVARLREHKPALVAMIERGEYRAAERAASDLPPNRIAPGCRHITPAMLSLVTLDQASIDALVAGVPGGAANVQDIYPLAPLQQGILYHHASARGDDPYVMQVQFAFADRERLQAFAKALRTVIARHDILRTSVHWHGLETPVQVVWRHAELSVQAADAGTRSAIDLGQAPLMRLHYHEDAGNGRVEGTLLFHHIAMDHSALEVVRHEIQACLLGQAQALGAPVPFRNYVAQACLGITEAQHEAFFREMLGDLDTPTLAYGLQDLSGDGSGVLEHSLALDPALCLRLRGLARQRGVSVASLFHLGWARVLAGLTGGQHVVFGTVLMGRLLGAEATERALGIFINTLPLRLDVQQQSVQDALQATHQRLTALMRHEHAPLALAQRCSGVAAPTPLFNSLLNYRHSASVPSHGATWQGIEVIQAEERSNYPLVLSVDDLGEGFSLTAQAAPGIEARRICGYLECALQHLSHALEQAPHAPVAQLNMLALAERSELLDGLNPHAAPYASDVTLHQRIERQALERGHAIAAQVGAQQLTYAELNQQANALAHHLIGLGVRPDQRVAVVARRGLHTLVGLLAVLKAGAGYVPVDPAHPDDRLGYLLDDSAPVAVLTQQALLGRLPALGVPVLALDAPHWPQHTENPQVAGLTPAHLAYVIYTSGSTGQPKGVMVEHRTLNNLVDWHCAAFDLQPGSHTASVAGFGFDAMAWEVWPALCAGATLHLPPAEIANEQLDALLQWWLAQPLQVAFLPTPVAEYAFSRDLRHPTLRTLLIGGDRLRQFNRDPGFAVINNYGPTEATVVATSGPVLPGGALDIGRPIANTRIYLLDAQRQPVPFGVAGELYIGGAGVARGYLNRAEMTAERFLHDPFSTAPAARMYRTGDLARWNAEGTLDYLGRNDDQVKVRGVRIELGEIEAQLNRLPAVEEAVVLAREDVPGQLRLVAYFIGKAGAQAPGAEQMRSQLLTQLPDYMVPAAYVPLPAWPLTANGKLDRKALPRPDATALINRGHVAPQGELEGALAALWAELLQVERVGRHDHFFELGGHSLLAMRMVSQVRQRLGLELELGTLFANSELAAVAAYLAEAAGSQLPAITPAAHGERQALSFAQQRLWFLAQMDGGNQAYNIPLALRLRGALDSDALRRALQRVVERHETLRSRFIAVDEAAQVQFAAPAGDSLLLPCEDLRARPETLAARLDEEAQAPFDLAGGGLIRGRLLRLADDEHVLLLSVHHIVADGWSMEVLTHEVQALYQAFSTGQHDPLPELAVQYADYAAWQRDWLRGEVLQRQADYWQHTLSGAPALLMLPTDRPRPAQQDYAGGSVALHLEPSLYTALQALAQRHGVTLYMSVLSAWAVLLARLSGQGEVVIGSPVANRRSAEVEGLIGLFVNTLALRLDTSGEPSVAALLARSKACVLAAQAHQDLPFEQVVEVLRPPRSLAHSPLFQASLSWNTHAGTPLQLGELAVESIGAPMPFAKFDLTLSLAVGPDGLQGALEYASALFDEATVQRYAGYLQQLLRAMVDDDQGVPAHVPLLQAPERERLLVGFNATAVDYDLQQSLHGLFEAQVQRTPHALAVQAEDAQLSYMQLNQAANRLAHHLIAQGVKPDDRVAICVERGVPMVVGLLAILKAGGAYVPLDPAYPQERIRYMLDDSAPVAVLIEPATRALLGEVQVPLIDLQRQDWQDANPGNPQVAGLTSHHLAYVIYTSGSTGQPKGVMNEHAGVVNRLLWMQDAYRLGAADAVLQKTPFSFDVSVWEFFWPLQTGARLVMARPGGHKDPAYLREVIQAERITTLHFVPSMLDVFLAHGDASSCNGLKRVLCSGEALPGSLVRRFKVQLPSVQLHNLYGPTEAAVDVSAWHCAEPLAQTPDNTPIGTPIANTALYILDERGQPVPQGVVGELYIGGVQVARGYLNRAQLSAERFLDDPFSRRPGARLYRTGDLARHLADGALEYLGRNDDQVKIRGLRIELGEIQAQLTRQPGVQEAVVLAREDQPGDKRLVAYYTAPAALPVAALRTALLAELPDYMVPALFVHLAALPLSPNGKLDRKALPAPGADALPTRPYEAPQGATEHALAHLWAQLLGVERVGRDDNFFEMGGHSLLAVTLLARMRKQGLHADIRVLFNQPTLAALASAVGADTSVQVPANLIDSACTHITPALLPLVTLTQDSIDRIVASIPGGAANVQDIYPLAPLQTGILYHHLTATEGDPYLLKAHFVFADQARLQAFTQALQRVIERNDILRTSLFWEGLANPVQVVWRQAPLQVLEYSQVGRLDQLQDARLDLAQAPLLRLVYARDPASQRFTAALLFHHLVMDHVALEVLRHELQAVLLGQEHLLDAAVPYRNYVAQTLLGLDEAAHEAYFAAQLGDIDEPSLPYGQAPLDEAQVPAEFAQRLDAALGGQVREHARQLGVSPASLMHLAWAQVLGQLCGRSSVVFGTVLLGRLHGAEGVERALGVFINTLPLRIDLHGLSVRDAVLGTHRQLTALLAHEHAQLALAQRCSALPAGAPLFSALLNYRHGNAAPAHDAHAEAAWQGIELLHAQERTNYPLTLSIDDLGDAFAVTALAAPGIDPQAICAYLEQALANLVAALAQGGEQALAQLTVLPAAQRTRLLHHYNDTARDYPRELPVHRLFEQRVAQHPQAVAVVHGDRSLTYAELDRRANRLAHYLIGLGVKAQACVGLLLPRSLELVIAELAIGKCAAVYVPLDIHAPAERHAYMLQDCQAVAVIGQGTTFNDPALRCIDLDHLQLDDQPSHAPGLTQAGDSLAYVMYTSGSTGAPKGVCVTHRGIARLVLNNGFADLGARDRIAFASNPAFDASTLEVWGALLNGGQVVVIDHLTLVDPTRFSDALRKEAISVLFLTTALFNNYVQLIPQALGGLRLLFTGGERADPAAFRALLALGTGVRLMNAYGPTETTTFATFCHVQALAQGAQTVPIGRPIGNTSVYVLDEYQRLAPPGVVGELYIGGDGVARGYLNRPELSAERFLVDPFSQQPGALMYRTGDLVRWCTDGQLECLGRNDDQVKIRGFRIELGEIVSCLHQLPGLGETVVLAREDEPGRLRLVAYFTTQAEAEAPSVERIRAHLQTNLPEYMVPTAFVELTALPLTANGKLDRRALPRPDRLALFERHYEAPQDGLETALAQIWAEVLDVERVGRHDHFFALGGHSLLAMRMVSQVRQQLGVELPLGELFALGELAAVAHALAGVGRSELPDILPVPGGQPQPLSFAQQRLWFLAQMEGGSQAYNMALALGLRGALDVAALQGALACIVERHQTLRSRFVPCEEGAEVVIDELPAGPLLRVEDLRGCPDTLGERLREAAIEPFDLSRGPLLRGCLLQLADDYHVLSLTLHHIVADGWSMGVLSTELLALYGALRQGRADALAPLAIQYADYAVWQRRWLVGERLQHQADYWRQALDGAPGLLMLPTDRPRPAQQDFSGASVAIRLDAALASGLRALARRRGATLYMTLMSAWAAVLARLSGQAEVVVGSPVAGRGRAELEGLIGLFVNTLAIRIDTSGNPSGEALLGRVKARVLEAQDHQDLPFEQVVEIVRPVRSLAHPPLFQTTLNWLPGDTLATRVDTLVLELVEQSGQVAKFDLSLNLGEQGDALVGSLEYATALFDEATVHRYAGYFEHLLRALVADDQVALEQVPLVQGQEREQLLEGFNATALSLAQGHTVQGLIEARAHLAPDSVAARAGEQQLSYAELNHQANALAHHLIAVGVRPDDRVAVLARRGLEALVGLLAVLKAGGAYVPIDPAHPDERLRYLLEDSAPVAVLTQQALLGRLPGVRVPLIALDLAHWPQHLHNPQVPGLSAAHLAYVIYTSGSTGQPKGVMVEHRTLVNLVGWHCQAFGLQAGSHTASVAGFGFDAMAWEVWPALCAGAVLHLPPADVGNEQLDSLLDWWQAQPLDVAFLPTPVAEYAFSRALRHPTLRTLLIGGDRLRQFNHDPGFAVVNNYGPTEATVVATSGTLLPGGALDIGKPIANTRVYLLDAHRQLVPVGVAGELYVAGAGVARGYLNQAEMTAERFLDDPFSQARGARMYRTGDLARWNADGTLDYLGRNDDQVKIRGLRIELGEIEAQLGQVPGIEEALVLAREDEPGQPRLVAYFTPRGNAVLTVGELRAALLARLPGYMVPGAFVALDTWPLTANGKVDRRALPVPGREALFSAEYQAPQGALETTLARLWGELLQVERVGRHDHFFELGGHSLLAVTLLARMCGEGLDADIRVLFAQPTLAALAAAVGHTAGVSAPDNLIEPGCTRITPALLPLVTLEQAALDRIVASVPGGAANVQDIYPLGPLQTGIFYHHLSAGDDDPYLLQARFAFSTQARLDAFCQALQRMIARHDILRTALYWEGLAAPVQVVVRHAELSVEARALHALEAPTRLDLAQAPLLRLLHAHDPDNGRIVGVLLFHHVIMDHMALELLGHELHAVLLGQEALLPAPVPYRNYIAQSLQGPGAASHEAFFAEQLADIDEPTLPYGLQRLAADGPDGLARHTLQADLCQRVRQQAQQAGVTPASLMHLAWARVLGQLSGRDKVVFGSVLLGRLQGGEGADKALGLFINTLPLRVEVGEQSVRAALRDTHRRLTALLGHEHAPLALAQRCSALAQGVPLFSALFNYRHSAPGQAEPQASAAWEGIELLRAEERSTYPVTLSVDDLGAGFSLTAHTAPGIDAERICAYMACAVQHLVTALEQAPHTPMAQLRCLPTAERAMLLDGFNACQAPHETGLTVHQRIERQAAQRPDAVAAQVGTQHLSFGELNRQANALAHHLIGLGVRPDDRVAVLAWRGLETLVGLLAVLKAGAGYVPVDPAHPDERVRYLLEDSAPVVVLTQQALTGRLAHLSVPVLALDRPGWAQRHDNPQVPGLTPAHLAYVIYTSGSTGQPKGVMVEHHSVNNLVDWHCRAFDLHSGSHTASVAGFGFDAMAWEVWPALCAGGVLHLPPAEVVNEQLDALLDWWLAQPLEVAFLPTPVAEYAFSRALRHPTLRTLLIGGDRLRQFNHDPGFAVVNNYGPTEATVVASSGTLEVGGVLHIGKPVSNARLYVLDAQRQPQPLGVPGELYVGGAGVARGYLNLAQLSAERFLDDPFSTLAGARMYRTGDLVRWLADGTLEYLGRNDDQVKVRGMRIELGEVEQHLAQCPGVAEAVVSAQPLEQGGMRLVAYFTPLGAAVEPATLRACLLQRLPDYMVPTAYVSLDALPLTANGKVDRKALPAPALQALLVTPYQAPATAMEQRLASYWAGLLDVQQVGRHDSFFALGGHSLLAIQLVSQLQQAGLPLTLADLFQHVTLEGLARVLEQRAEAPGQAPQVVSVREQGSQPPLFLVHDFTGLDAYFPVLGRQLPGDYPIYGLAGTGPDEAPLHTLECQAARLVERIRAVQPHGPYRLAGWSYGGVLAYEVAAQLLGMDEPVAFLGLIDTYVPRLTDRGKARWQGPQRLQRQLLEHCTAHWQAQGDAGLEALAQVQVLQDQGLAFSALLGRCRAQHLLPAELAQAADAPLQHYLEREVAHGHALAHYRVEPLGIDLHLFRAEQRSNLRVARSPSLGWGELLPTQTVHCINVPGDHLSMMQAPHVEVLGQAFGNALAGVPTGQPSGVAAPSLLAIQSGQPGRVPLFCVPGAGDGVTSFLGLVEALGPDWPVYGLQPRGLDGAGVPHSRVEAAAEWHVQAIEALYPQGSLNLLGHSFGGWVAHAMAVKLEARGRVVASLTLVDSEAPDGRGTCGKPYTATAAQQLLVDALQRSSGKQLGLQPQAFADADDASQLRLLHAAMVGAGLLPQRASSQALQGMVACFARALRTVYRPVPGYSGAVSLVLVADPSLDAAADQREQAATLAGWQQVLPQLVAWHGPGDHFSILKAPDVYSLAAWWFDGQAVAVPQGLA